MPTVEPPDRPTPSTAVSAEATAKQLVVLAAAMALLWLVVGRDSVSPAYASDRPTQAERAAVYRVDWKAPSGRWEVWAWGVAPESRRSMLTQARKRSCIRRSPTHRCRVTVEAVVDSVSAAHAYRRSRCEAVEDPPPGC
ncbi:hypothetical protein [Cryptosporangium minutisporangium]|uniref:Uncharacterized protein n=1 Tax=Cryptosporangium minutisporangium TaxID=113569 RepID=A0ABP6TBR8_9ACTN